MLAQAGPQSRDVYLSRGVVGLATRSPCPQFVRPSATAPAGFVGERDFVEEDAS
jgi:hypothetical protein